VAGAVALHFVEEDLAQNETCGNLLAFLLEISLTISASVSCENTWNIVDVLNPLPLELTPILVKARVTVLLNSKIVRMQRKPLKNTTEWILMVEN